MIKWLKKRISISYARALLQLIEIERAHRYANEKRMDEIEEKIKEIPLDTDRMIRLRAHELGKIFDKRYSEIERRLDKMENYFRSHFKVDLYGSPDLEKINEQRPPKSR